ncbi:MAG: 16S rRNA (cytosine(967)-C(5))-methyltransferase RsmB [Eubacteriales bacterium]|nr:16S rRNA (cytosine(967)-C(5))-methyltransferase RsmB [Eubacteriales bacterium]
MNKELVLSYRILNNVYFKKAYASIELNKNCQSDVNFNLVTKIVYGVIDNDVKLEYYLKQFYKKAPKKDVQLLLKLGAYVHFYIDSIPDFAMVNELVELSKHSKLKPYKSFINAVLKKIVTTPFELPSSDNKIEYLSIKFSKPQWFVQLLLNNFDYGFVTSVLSAELPTDTHIRINTLLTTVEDFKHILDDNNIKYQQSILDDGLYVDYSALIKIKDIVSLYTAQGIPSMIVSKNVVGNNILDACSAPGGKAVYIATLNPNAVVTACDIYDHRVKLIDDYAKRLNITNVKTCVNDASVFNPEFENKFDAVLLDVPCSGLGVVDKKPDILLNNQLKFDELPALQSKILDINSKYVKVGGSIIYSTCTILPAENENIINEFLNTHHNFKLDKVEVYKVPAMDSSGLKTFYPNISGTEGFFIGKLVRYE